MIEASAKMVQQQLGGATAWGPAGTAPMARWEKNWSELPFRNVRTTVPKCPDHRTTMEQHRNEALAQAGVSTQGEVERALAKVVSSSWNQDISAAGGWEKRATAREQQLK
eukprot:5779726-Amphidinium_carterae.1